MVDSYATTIRGVDGQYVGVTGGNLDVMLGDQTTPFGIMPLFLHDADFTIDTDIIIDTNTLNATTGHSITVGDIIVLKESPYMYQGIAIGVVGDVITLDTPVFRTFTSAGTVGESGVANAAVDGSVANKIFRIGPPVGSKWDLTKLTVQIEDATAMDTSLFGGIAALSKGVVVRKKDTIYQPMFNWKNNGQIILTSSDYAFDAKAPAGVFSFNSEIHIAGTQNYGVVVRVDGDLGDYIEMVIQDDLTDLINLFVIVHGHMVV